MFNNIDKFSFTDAAYSSFSIFGQGSFKWVTDKALSIINSPDIQEDKDLKLGDELANKYLRTHELELGYDLTT